MKSKSRIEITTEKTREISFRVTRRVAREFPVNSCAACAGEMLSINEAAKFSAFDWRVIVRLIKDGAVHSLETDAGEIFVCAASLAAIPRQ